ncbi:MAG: hypothetical protein K2X01_11805 [Cyanobacteria bacterium]|nr:hypothetical protein [Cyanobacteriota bacterium]
MSILNRVVPCCLAWLLIVTTGSTAAWTQSFQGNSRFPVQADPGLLLNREIQLMQLNRLNPMTGLPPKQPPPVEIIQENVHVRLPGINNSGKPALIFVDKDHSGNETPRIQVPITGSAKKLFPDAAQAPNAPIAPEAAAPSTSIDQWHW